MLAYAWVCQEALLGNVNSGSPETPKPPLSASRLPECPEGFYIFEISARGLVVSWSGPVDQLDQ